ncbi:hypothetical protein L211DRAFT_603824 [Terfezia boudieri ATCC MYA-4762]|uniref:Uncharacterized protein n=1 Tax=Terfezia boudieri ATCC MYA-4762 TaxID=1051890 RepID=A0A3N4LVW0_9PEZI|nr:hypothetical protein L211DRAFT_603824 [Terfezia boudieri ATCC MYA-4762]
MQSEEKRKLSSRGFESDYSRTTKLWIFIRLQAVQLVTLWQSLVCVWDNTSSAWPPPPLISETIRDQLLSTFTSYSSL